MSETNTLTVINQLGIATGITGQSQVFINQNPQNNVIERVSLSLLGSYLFLPGDIISNTNGTQTAYDLSPAFEFVPTTVEGALGVLDLCTVPGGDVLGASVAGAARPVAMTSLLDAAFSSVEGAVLYRGPDGWEALGPAAQAGYVLTAGPTTAPVTWEPSAAGPAIPTSATLLSTTASNTFQGLVLGANLALSGTTLSAAGSAWALSDGNHVVDDVSTLLVPGAVVSGASGAATLALEGAAWSLTVGTNTLSSMSELTVVGGSLTGTNGVGTLTFSGGGGGSALSVGDGMHSGASVSSILFSGATVSTPNTGTVGVSIAGSSLALSDGTHTVGSVTSISFNNATVSGTGGQASISVGGGGGGGGGGPSYAPGWGKGFLPASSAWNRPSLSAFTLNNSMGSLTEDITGGPILLVQGNGSGSNGWTTLTKTVNPNAAFSIEMLLEMDGLNGHAGMVFGDTETGNYYSFDCYLPNGQFYVTEWTGLTGPTAYNGNQANRDLAFPSSFIWLKLSYNGSGQVSLLTSYNPLDESTWVNFQEYTVGGSNFVANLDFVGFGVAGGSNPTPTSIRCWAFIQTSP